MARRSTDSGLGGSAKTGLAHIASARVSPVLKLFLRKTYASARATARMCGLSARDANDWPARRCFIHEAVGAAAVAVRVRVRRGGGDRPAVTAAWAAGAGFDRGVGVRVDSGAAACA